MLYLQVSLFASFCLWWTTSYAACDLRWTSSSLELAYSSLEATEVKTTDPYDIDGIETQLKVNGDHWRASHDYLALDFLRDNLTTPITNGDLHTLLIGYRDNVSYLNNGYLHWEILPALAVSSNQLKHADSIKGSSFRLDGHLLWQQILSSHSAVFAGACLTALTGDHELVPVMGIDYEYSYWKISIGYPYTKLQFQLTESLFLYSDMALTGNEWEVLNENLQQRSDVHLEAKQFRLGLKFNISAHGILEAYWRLAYDQSMNYLARDDSWASVKIGDSNGWMLRYVYLH